MTHASWTNLTYLVAAVLFIVGLKGLTHPRTAVRGNMLGALGMLIAVTAALLDQSIFRYWLIFTGVLAGAAIGAVLAQKVKMTAMPQMVALLNGFGGAASFLVAGAALLQLTETAPALANAAGEALPTGLPLAPPPVLIATALSGIIGAVTLTGSLVAFLKLDERISDRGIQLGSPHLINGLFSLVCIGLGTWMVVSPPAVGAFWMLVAVSGVWGVLLVINIGGADMPVVIALLNSYSGMAGAATGFVLGNNSALIIAGSLVGASGIILTQIMCRAMNRSLTNVLFGGVGTSAAKTDKSTDVYARVKSATADDVAMLLDAARQVVIIPGYGLAVSQAQHAVRDLTNLLESKGVSVEFGIHPVAGRMPGHMNILLAEASIDYDKLKEMDQINMTIAEADVVLVVGANDVVNPLARTDPASPIAGMPIINVDKARTVIVVKRSLSPGFAGIPNPLFAADNTLMYFGDGKQAILDMMTALKQV